MSQFRFRSSSLRYWFSPLMILPPGSISFISPSLHPTSQPHDYFGVVEVMYESQVSRKNVYLLCIPWFCVYHLCIPYGGVLCIPFVAWVSLKHPTTRLLGMKYYKQTYKQFKYIQNTFVVQSIDFSIGLTIYVGIPSLVSIRLLRTRPGPVWWIWNKKMWQTVENSSIGTTMK